MNRTALETRWLLLTRELLPAVALARKWPIVRDHCFQRVMLDNACGGTWYDHIAGRPAYRQASDAILERAVTLAEGALAGTDDLVLLNRRSLVWRGHPVR